MSDMHESPVLPPLATCMKVDFMWDDEGGAWILHDKPLPEILKWVDYDADRRVLTLNMASGRTQDLGLPIPAKAAPLIKKVAEIAVMFLKDGQVADAAIVPLNTISTGTY
jgi:hypothetical protein